MPARVFSPKDWHKVRDHTYVSPFLNPADTKSGLDSQLLRALPFSLAAGRIDAGMESLIHVHPVVAQVTLLLEGRLVVRLREPGMARMEERELGTGDAVAVLPGALLQLVNPGSSPCRTLYIVGPPYLFEADASGVVYDDSFAVGSDWEALATADLARVAVGDHDEHRRAREAAARRRGVPLWRAD